MITWICKKCRRVIETQSHAFPVGECDMVKVSETTRDPILFRPMTKYFDVTLDKHEPCHQNLNHGTVSTHQDKGSTSIVRLG